MTDHQVCNKSNRTTATRGARNAHLYGAPEYTPEFFCGVRIALSLTYCLVFCKIIVGLFVQFHLPLYFPSFFYFMDYDYPFGTYNFLLVKASILHDSTER